MPPAERFRAPLLFLLAMFCLGVGLRFLPRSSENLGDSMRLTDRLVLVAKFADELPAEAREGLLAAARAAEQSRPERLQVIDGQAVGEAVEESLPLGFRRLSAYQRAPSPAGELELRQMAQQAKGRIGLCLSLFAGLVLVALGTSLFGSTERRRPVEAMASLPPVVVLSLFFAWDVVNVFGLSLVVDGLGLRAALDPFRLLLLLQLGVYGLFLGLLRLARPRGGPWNLTWPLATAWIGRGYFACYALVLSVNLLISALTGHTPSSGNPLLGMFMQAAPWQVVFLATLVVVIGPAFEELIFRGWLLGGLREAWGDRRALLVSSLLFAFIHGDPWATPALLLLGWVFGLVYLRTGSLYASILLHAMWNGTTFIILLANMP